MRAKKSQAINPWAAIDAMVKQDPEPMGPEWFTKDDFAARYGYSPGQAYRKCKAMYKSGVLKSWSGISATNRRLTTKYSAA
jgi:hypothetical protein